MPLGNQFKMTEESNTSENKEPKKRGRPKGSTGRHRRPLGVVVKDLENGGEMPLDYMLRVMRDRRVPKPRRDQMAVKAAPYCHAPYASVKVTNPHLPLAQIIAGMKPDELAAFENIVRGVVSRLQPERHALGYRGGEGAPVG